MKTEEWEIKYVIEKGEITWRIEYESLRCKYQEISNLKLWQTCKILI